jgi:hypothetical protein
MARQRSERTLLSVYWAGGRGIKKRKAEKHKKKSEGKSKHPDHQTKEFLFFWRTEHWAMKERTTMEFRRRNLSRRAINALIPIHSHIVVLLIREDERSGTSIFFIRYLFA